MSQLSQPFLVTLIRYSVWLLFYYQKLYQLLRLQVKFELMPSQKGGIRTELSIKYIADFVYYDLYNINATMIIEDVKGIKTPAYIIKRKLMKFNGLEITEL